MKKLYYFLFNLFICSVTFAQIKQDAKTEFINNQYYLSEKSSPDNFSGNDSLNGFDEKALTSRLLAAGVHGAEYIHYSNQMKRNFIIEKYGLKSISKVTEKKQNSKLIGSANGVQFSPCINEGFELTPPGTYTAANAITGWSLSSRQVNSCSVNATWVPGSSEFSIVSTPVINFPQIGNIPNSPLGGTRVALLNDLNPNQNSTRLTQTLSVTNTNNTFKFAFAAILQDGTHNCCEQSQFQVEISDCLGNRIACFSPTFVPSSVLCTPTSPGYYNLLNGFAWTNWRVETIDLTAIIGNCITISFISNDCIFGGHYATVLVDAVCGTGLTVLNTDINGSLNGWVNYCAGSGQAQLNAPANFASYQWFSGIPNFIPTTSIPQATTSSLMVSNPTLIPPSYYYVVLTTSTGCVFTASYVIAPTQVSISAVGSGTTCINGSSGTASVYAMGSGTGYTYSWLNSANSVVGTSSTISNMPPGIYTVSVNALGSPGCGSGATSVTIGTGISTFSTFLKPYCSPEAYFTTIGGSNFQWYNNQIPIPPPLGTAASYTNTAPCNGCFFQVAYDLNGCRDSIEYTMINSSPGSILITTSQSVCPGPGTGTAVISLSQSNISFPITNSFHVYSTGSLTPPYSASLNPTTSNTFMVTGLSGNQPYNVNVFDGACVYSTSFFIHYLAPPFDFTINSSSANICDGNSITAGISFTTQPLPSQYNYSWTPNLYIGGNASLQNITISPTLSLRTPTTLIYSLVVTPTVANCPLTKTLSITVNPSPGLMTSFGQKICKGEIITLTVTGADTYMWNTLTTGSVITVSPDTTTTYTVTGTNLVGPCSNTQQVTVTVSECTSLGEWFTGENFQIYPNPTAGKFFIETTEKITITISDEIGKTILERNLVKGNYELNLTEYSNGIYILKANNGNDTKTIKLVKKD